MNSSITKNNNTSIWPIIFLLVWPYYLNDIYIIALHNSSLGLLWLLDVIFYLIIPSVTLFILWKKNYIDLSQMSCKNFRALNLIEGIFLFIALILIINKFIEPNLLKFMKYNEYSYDFPSEFYLKWITIVYASISAGFLEEMIYRQIFFNKIYEKYGNIIIAILLSSIIFSIAHWSQGLIGLIITFLWGAAAAAWYSFRKEIYPLIIAHTLYDFFVFGEFF